MSQCLTLMTDQWNIRNLPKWKHLTIASRQSMRMGNNGGLARGVWCIAGGFLISASRNAKKYWPIGRRTYTMFLITFWAVHNSTWMDGMMIYGKIKNQLGAAAGLWPNLYGKKKNWRKRNTNWQRDKWSCGHRSFRFASCFFSCLWPCLPVSPFGCWTVVAATRLHKAHLTSALAHCPVFIRSPEFLAFQLEIRTHILWAVERLHNGNFIQFFVQTYNVCTYEHI